MEDASSDFSDWEVLSAASAPDDDAVVVSGQGGDVLHDHFGLDDPSSFHAAEASTWSEAAASEDEEVESGLGSVDRFDSTSPEPVDLVLTAVVDSTARSSQLGGVDVTAQGSVLGASSASRDGAIWAAQDEEIQEAQIEAARRCGEPDSIPAHQEGAEGILDSDATAVDGARVQTENSSGQLEDGGAESSIVQSEDGGADATAESSVPDAAAAGDEVKSAPAEEVPEQGKDASDASDCGESDGDGKDCSSPLVAAAAPVTGEGGESRVVVWWRLPFRLIHYCAWKVKPVWSVSIAAAFLGIVVLGRRMYRMRRKARGLPQIKIALDDKRVSQFADRAARLNEAFLIAKRIPALRTSSGAALPWSMMQER